MNWLWLECLRFELGYQFYGNVTFLEWYKEGHGGADFNHQWRTCNEIETHEDIRICRIYDTNKNIQLVPTPDIAYITGLKDHKISDRFVDKIIDIVSRHGTEELAMLFNCAFLVLNDMESKNPLNTKTGK